ncbi:MAG: hypothetical protein U1G07_10625 [Verrucomicrobiota bacterium]
MCKSDDQTPNAARELATYRVDRLQELLDAIGTDNRFYAHKLQTNVPQRITRLEEFAAFPFTTEPSWCRIRYYISFGTNLTFRFPVTLECASERVELAQPLRWLDTEDSWSWMVDAGTKCRDAASVWV